MQVILSGKFVFKKRYIMCDTYTYMYVHVLLYLHIGVSQKKGGDKARWKDK